MNEQTSYRKPEPTAKRFSYHDLLSITQSLENSGKGKLAKQIKPAVYRIMADDNVFRVLRQMIESEATKAELLGVIDTAMGVAK